MEIDKDKLQELVGAAEVVIEDHHSGFSWEVRQEGITALGKLAYDFRVELTKLQAREIGQEHGENAAGYWSQVAIGAGIGDVNERAARFLIGIDDGDPEIMDALPACDLSGQYADGYTVEQLCADVDAPPDDPENQLVLPSNEIADAYTEAFDDAVMREVTRACRYQLSFESESAAIQAWIDDEPVHCNTCYGRLARHDTPAAWKHADNVDTHPAEPIIIDTDNA